MSSRKDLIKKIKKWLDEADNALVAEAAGVFGGDWTCEGDRFYRVHHPEIHIPPEQRTYLEESCDMSPVPVGAGSPWRGETPIDTPEENTGKIVAELMAPRSTQEACWMRVTLYDHDGTVLTTKEFGWQDGEYKVFQQGVIYELEIV
jgi:hypothetical protein